MDLGLGVEILYRPPWHSFPQGMTPLQKHKHPEVMPALEAGQELVQLLPRFDFPITMKPHPWWRIFPRPHYLSLPAHIHLLQFIGDDYEHADSLPFYILPVHLPDGIKVPRNVLGALIILRFSIKH